MTVKAWFHLCAVCYVPPDVFENCAAEMAYNLAEAYRP